MKNCMLYMLTALLLLLPALSCEEDKKEDSCVYNKDISPLTFTELGETNEDIAFDGKGFMYASGLDRILKISPDGTVTEFASGLGNPCGIAFDVNLNLFVAEYGGRIISKISPDGTVMEFSKGTDTKEFKAPNHLAFNKKGILYVSDGSGSVFILKPDSAASEFPVEGAKSLNGMAVDTQGEYLYVNDLSGPLWKIKINSDNSLSGPENIALNFMEEISMGDGIVFDNCGSMFITHSKTLLARINLKDNSIENVYDFADAGYVCFIANIQFGNGEGFDPGKLYFAQLYGTAIGYIETGTEGAPLPLP